MYSYIFRFERTAFTDTATENLRALGFIVHPLSEGTEVSLLEHQNPGWEFTPSLIRLIEAQVRYFCGGLVHVQKRKLM